jgi:hypothetical protein
MYVITSSVSKKIYERKIEQATVAEFRAFLCHQTVLN